MNTFLFYDIETTGLNPAFDQILQFGAIRTDMDLQEIERTEILVKLRPDAVPAPGAILTTGIDLETHNEGAICEYEAIKRIHEMVNQSGTISIGYNSLNFDDEFLRFSFYRNLLDPYTHQWQNGCRRADILPMALFFKSFRPDIIKWPVTDEGKSTMKLEKINELNHLAEGQAHDAMTDIEATLNLARRMKAHPELWDYCLSNFEKKQDETRSLKAWENHGKGFLGCKTGTILDTGIGADRGYMAPVVWLGTNQIKQQILMRLDAFEFSDIDTEAIDETSFVTRKKYGEPPFSFPNRKRLTQHFDSERVDLEKRNLDFIKNNSDKFERITRFWLTYEYPLVTDIDPDARLYTGGFASANEKRWNEKFHEHFGTEYLFEVVEQMPANVRKDAAYRILFRNLPEESEKRYPYEFSDFLEQSLHGNPKDYRDKHKASPKEISEEIREIINEQFKEKEIPKPLESLRKYIEYVQ
ncbi:exodeoxyribonuclease I (plasmid) [Fulvitalea axinellae]|uniref:Exodeoxyribonuclease I n=1 Tax=Fulvitalea axinellae TaxID=1182444 RepID=A0AAU9CWH6_9BACT|nr:exodeoxyribonuclease I [Fulvitalea axinellae]